MRLVVVVGTRKEQRLAIGGKSVTKDILHDEIEINRLAALWPDEPNTGPAAGPLVVVSNELAVGRPGDEIIGRLDSSRGRQLADLSAFDRDQAQLPLAPVTLVG